MQRIFLDTSVQAERILGELDRRVSIARRLTQPDIEAFTCGYVWMEYQRSLIADFAHVHRQFLTAQSLEEAMTWVASCRKETASCHLPDFLAGKRPELRTVSDYLAAHPGVIKDQERVCRLLPAVLDDPRAALGQAACWPLGDVIVALHVPAGTALWTLDPDFEPLAAALGLALHEPTAEGRPGSSPH